MTGEEIDAIEMAIVLVQLALNDKGVAEALKAVKSEDISLYDQFMCFMTEPAVQERLKQGTLTPQARVELEASKGGPSDTRR